MPDENTLQPEDLPRWKYPDDDPCPIVGTYGEHIYTIERGGKLGDSTSSGQEYAYLTSPQGIARAHQYLYYVLCEPVISDMEYDEFCKIHGIDGGGGSDRASDYTAGERAMSGCLRDLAKRKDA